MAFSTTTTVVLLCGHSYFHNEFVQKQSGDDERCPECNTISKIINVKYDSRKYGGK